MVAISGLALFATLAVGLRTEDCADSAQLSCGLEAVPPKPWAGKPSQKAKPGEYQTASGTSWQKTPFLGSMHDALEDSAFLDSKPIEEIADSTITTSHVDALVQALKDQVAYAELDVAGWRAQGVSGVAAMRAKGILPVRQSSKSKTSAKNQGYLNYLEDTAIWNRLLAEAEKDIATAQGRIKKLWKLRHLLRQKSAQRALEASEHDSLDLRLADLESSKTAIDGLEGQLYSSRI